MAVRDVIVEWFERVGDEKRQRAFMFNNESRMIEDYQDYEKTAEYTLEVMAKKDVEKMRTHPARKIIFFAKKELRNGNN